MNAQTMNAKTLTLLLLAALPLAAQADRQYERTVAPDGAKEVRISNTAGSIEVAGSDRQDIRITGVLEDDVEEVLIERQGSAVAIEVKVADGLRSWHRASAELRIEMPAAMSLSVTGTSADIDTEGVRGEQRLKSVSGDVRTEVWGEPVTAETVSGDVRVEGHGEVSRARLAAVSGDLVAEALAGELEAESVSGDVIVSDSRVSRARFETTSGDVIATVSLERDGSFQAESVSGDVELDIAGEPDAEIDVTSFSGSIDNCFGPRPERQSRYAPGSELRFTAGEGRGEIRLQTLSGDIGLCKM
ncbi:MAG TPA: DUF4097 family beta strand repeat-containing protein [Woeseiaceae bacterium]|nr:DUF4097 family beta strand repeat-containing protein [Woeseiaceae bacterium]